MRTGIMAIAVFSLCILITCPLSILARGRYERDTLRDLKGVDVMVEALDEEAETAGLDVEQLKKIVEEKLRDGGVTVLTQQQSLGTPGMPYLYVNVQTVKVSTGGNSTDDKGAVETAPIDETTTPDETETTSSGDGYFIYYVEVALKQRVSLARNQSIRISSKTWRAADMMGIVPPEKLRDRISSIVDSQVGEFISDYMQVNNVGSGG